MELLLILTHIMSVLAITKQKQFRTLYTKSNLSCMSMCVLEGNQCPMYHYDQAAKTCNFVNFDPTVVDPIFTSTSDGFKVVADVETPLPQRRKLHYHI